MRDVPRLTDLDGIRKSVHGTKHALERITDRFFRSPCLCIISKVFFNRTGNAVGDERICTRDEFIDITGSTHIKDTVLL